MYLDILEELLENQAQLYKNAYKGDFSQVCYLEAKDKEHGTYDKNYTNRLRLSYFLLYKHINNEDIVKRLFEEELKDRETNSFQGIGSALEILTFLLMKYNREGTYDSLFERAKTANFDCACGYTPNVEISSELEDCDIYDGISIAIDMGCMESARKLVKLWKEDIACWDKRNYERLIYFNKDIKREEENEEPLKALAEIARAKGKNSDIISTLRSLLHYYIQFDKKEQAYDCFQQLIREGDLTEIYHIRLFEYILEDCMELICEYKEKAEELWKWARPFIIERAGNMFGNLYKKSILAAETVNDDFSGELNYQYQEWKKRVGI